MFEILRNRSFARYFFGTTVSSIGNGMNFIAISWLLLQLTGTTSSMGWLLAVTCIPGILFSPWIGILVDRVDRRLLCMGADLFRAVIVLILPVLYYMGLLHTWELYLSMFLTSIGDRIYWPASGGFVREIVPVDKLLSANSLSSIFMQMGYLLGNGLAGLLMARFQPVVIMFITCGCLIFSSICTYLVRKGYFVARSGVRRKMSQDFTEGIGYMKSHPFLIGVAVVQIFLYFALYTVNVLLPVFSAHVLNVGATGFGFIDGAWAAGAMVGGLLLVTVVSKKLGEYRYSQLGMMFLTVSIVVFTLSYGLFQAVAGYFLMGLFFVSTRITYDTIIQSEVSTEFQGRVKSTISMVIAYVSFGIYVGVGYLGDVLPLRMLYSILAVIILTGGILAIVIFRIKARNDANKANQTLPI